MGEMWQGIIAGVVSGLLVGGAVFAGQLMVDNNRSDRDHAREDAQIERQKKVEDDRVRAQLRLGNQQIVRSLSSPDPNLARPFAGLDLTGMKLGGLKLVGADFSDANLTDVSFTGSDLRGATFDGANVDGADFGNADLQKASFQYSNDFRRVSGKSPDGFLGANLDGSQWLSIKSWRDTQLWGASFCGARFRDVDFSKATMWGTRIDGASVTYDELTINSDYSDKIEYCSQGGP